MDLKHAEGFEAILSLISAAYGFTSSTYHCIKCSPDENYRICSPTSQTFRFNHSIWDVRSF